MKTKITKIILIILGILLFSSFVWLRFIRERLPKEIPFNLTMYGFIILVYICSIYIYIITQLYFNIQSENKRLSLIVDMIYKPLLALDEAFKNNSFIKRYYERFLVYLINRIKNNVTLDKESTSYFKFYIILQIIPRVILVTALLIDTFYFHRLAILYKVLLVGLFILISKYIKYSFKYAKEHYILQLEKMVQKIMTDYEDPEQSAYDSLFTTMLTVREFIEVQVYIVEDGLEGYTCSPISTHEYNQEFRKRNNLPATHRFTREEHERKKAEIKEIMDKVIDISVHISKYEIAGIYILIKSIHTLDIEEIISIIKIKDIIEPFSGLDI